MIKINNLKKSLPYGRNRTGGIEVSKYYENQRCDLRKANIGFVFQSFNRINELTVFENVELPLVSMIRVMLTGSYTCWMGKP
jgi:ABC-type lipoprotein export system ATPase subunit